MVTGAALDVVFREAGLLGVEQLKASFLELATSCSIVIACRVSPMQKALMVKLVREGVKPTPVTLAVGDGANDVPMIQEAQVGVGIAGREGRQAVNNSDFSIGQFSFLKRLLLVHGRWNYRRICKFTLYTFWRNNVQVLLIFFYTFYSGFSGTSIFDDWIRLSFNFLCSIPIMATGCFDQDITAQIALEHPNLYDRGRLGRDLSIRKILQTQLSAVVHSLVLYWVTWATWEGMALTGVGDYYTFGTAVYTCMLVDMNYRVAFINITQNRYTIGAVLFSFVCYGIFLVVYPCTPLVNLFTPNMYMVPMKMVSSIPFWLCLVCTVALVMGLDTFFLMFYRRFVGHGQDRAIYRKLGWNEDAPKAPTPKRLVCSKEHGKA